MYDARKTSSQMPNKGWRRHKSGGHAHQPESKQGACARGRHKMARLQQNREATAASRQVAFVDDDGERVVMEPLTLPSDAKLQQAWTNGQGRSRMQMQRYTTRYAEYIISCGPRCRKGQKISSKTVKQRARRTKEMMCAFQSMQLSGAHLDQDDSEEITVLLQSMGILSSLYTIIFVRRDVEAPAEVRGPSVSEVGPLSGAHLDQDDSEEITVLLQSMGILSSL
eukprot:g60420.t1